MRCQCSFAVWALAACLSGPLIAPAAVPFEQSGCDRIWLTSNEVLEAVVLRRTRGELWLAVERSWLTRRYPGLARRWDDAAKAEADQRAREVVGRIEEWSRRRSDWPELLAFLRAERKRLEETPPVGGTFFLREIPGRTVRRVRLQPAGRRRVCLAAWVAGVTGVTDRTVAQLRKILGDRRIDPEAIGFDEFLALLPPKVDSPAEWRVRQALVEWQFGPKLMYQGTSAFWIEVDEQGQPAGGLAAGRGLESLAAELLGGAGRAKSPLETATAEAHKRKLAGFLVKELQTGAGGVPRQVSVKFYVVFGERDARPAISISRPIKPGDAAAVKQLEQDPQIAEALSLVRSLGLDIDAGRLQMALGAGAGVQQALRDADAAFVRQQQLYARSLDAPLWWP